MKTNVLTGAELVEAVSLYHNAQWRPATNDTQRTVFSQAHAQRLLTITDPVPNTVSRLYRLDVLRKRDTGNDGFEMVEEWVPYRLAQAETRDRVRLGRNDQDGSGSGVVLPGDITTTDDDGKTRFTSNRGFQPTVDHFRPGDRMVEATDDTTRHNVESLAWQSVPTVDRATMPDPFDDFAGKDADFDDFALTEDDIVELYGPEGNLLDTDDRTVRLITNHVRWDYEHHEPWVRTYVARGPSVFIPKSVAAFPVHIPLGGRTQAINPRLRASTYVGFDFEGTNVQAPSKTRDLVDPDTSHFPLSTTTHKKPFTFCPPKWAQGCWPGRSSDFVENDVARRREWLVHDISNLNANIAKLENIRQAQWDRFEGLEYRRSAEHKRVTRLAERYSTLLQQAEAAYLAYSTAKAKRDALHIYDPERKQQALDTEMKYEKLQRVNRRKKLVKDTLGKAKSNRYSLTNELKQVTDHDNDLAERIDRLRTTLHRRTDDLALNERKLDTSIRVIDLDQERQARLSVLTFLASFGAFRLQLTDDQLARIQAARTLRRKAWAHGSARHQHLVNGDLPTDPQPVQGDGAPLRRQSLNRPPRRRRMAK
jgi:hypothetical protein